MLHITNGDSANLYLKRIGVEGRFVAWHDVLHDGPLPKTNDLVSASQTRAAFLADYFCLSLSEVQKKFEKRNKALLSLEADESVVLWLTPELFDCLIGLQFLNWYQARFSSTHHLSVVFFKEHLPPNELTAQDVMVHFRTRFSPSEALFELANKVWQGLLSEPVHHEALLAQDFTFWPALKPALKRYFEEQPDADGLTRTQWQMLDCLNQQSLSLAQLFGAVQQLEEMPFMGDLSFWCQLEQMRQYIDISSEQSLLHQDIEFYHVVKATLSEKASTLLNHT